ncbi:hypothetical protein C5E10_15885 [Pseudoclavibacter sp. RFBG4]|nr:hypothetical protein C5E10_15885 [Pseudoclavibacter sp. RFBG4]
MSGEAFPLADLVGGGVELCLEFVHRHARLPYAVDEADVEGLAILFAPDVGGVTSLTVSASVQSDVSVLMTVLRADVQ